LKNLPDKLRKILLMVDTVRLKLRLVPLYKTISHHLNLIWRWYISYDIFIDYWMRMVCFISLLSSIHYIKILKLLSSIRILFLILLLDIVKILCSLQILIEFSYRKEILVSQARTISYLMVLWLIYFLIFLLMEWFYFLLGLAMLSGSIFASVYLFGGWRSAPQWLVITAWVMNLLTTFAAFVSNM